jgi:hypothetical protein
MALKRVSIPSPNYSSRGGNAVRLIVLHTAEGATTYQSLGNYFANPSSGVSSHAGIDDTPNTVGEYVPRSGASWTAAAANGYSIQAELCAFAEWDAATWNAHPTMLSNTAAWVAEEAAAFGIPLVGLTAAQAQGGVAGVCQHNDLGASGGGHWDCGPAFPIAQVIAMAKGGSTPSPAPSTETGHEMIASTSTGKGYWTATYDGAVSAFGDAAYKGNVYEKLAPGTSIVGIAGKGSDGYWLLGSDGGVFTFGSAGYFGRPDRV